MSKPIKAILVVFIALLFASAHAQFLDRLGRHRLSSQSKTSQ